MPPNSANGNPQEATSKRYIDPKVITHDCIPVIVLSASATAFFSWGIRWRTDSSWNHVMMMIRPGWVASQDTLFKEKQLSKYLKKNSRLKFWVIKDLTKEERAEMLDIVSKELDEPWYSRLYDYLGVLGQLTGLRKLNVPWLHYCSEKVVQPLRVVMPNLRDKPTPGEIDEEMAKCERFSCLGYWWD